MRVLTDWSLSVASALSGWLVSGSKCYLFKGKKGDAKADWNTARKWCRDNNGDLAVIDTHSENGNEAFPFITHLLHRLLYCTELHLSYVTPF